MEDPVPKPKVIIIGAGIAGLTLSLLLAKHHIPSLIFEARPQSHTQGGTLALAPNALRVLDHCGVYEQIRAL
ncbi:hypothetical protein HYFRA_00011967, partial [Hymenoscyphus fraxineus]